MNQRTRRRVDTGFKSLRDLALCCLGAWVFWVLTTRVSHPDPLALAFSVALMAAPSLASLYRIVNAILGASERFTREMSDREDTP